MTAEELAAGAGILLSLGISYIPGINEKFGKLSPAQKRLVMLGLLAAIAVGAFGLGCAGLAGAGTALITCDRTGAWAFFRVLVPATIANQAAFSISPPLLSRKKAS